MTGLAEFWKLANGAAEPSVDGQPGPLTESGRALARHCSDVAVGDGDVVEVVAGAEGPAPTLEHDHLDVVVVLSVA